MFYLNCKDIVIMKKIIQLYIVIFFPFLFTNCAKILPWESASSNPEPLELHGGKVSYKFSAALPPKAVPKGRDYVLKNFYVYGAEEKEVGALSFKSSDYPQSKTSQSQQTQTCSFPYEPSMKDGELYAQATLITVANGKTQQTERVKVGIGVITTSELLQPIYDIPYVDHGYNDQEELIPNQMSFYFPQGISRLSRQEIRSQRVKDFDLFVASKNVTRTVTITGLHSPEGTEQINTHLAPARAAEIEKWYRRRLKKYSYRKNAIDAITFSQQSIVRDWTPFRELLRGLETLSEQERQQVLAIVNGGGSYEDKQSALEKLSFYQRMLQSLYPSLRVAQTTVMTVKPKKTQAEILTLAQKIAAKEISAETLSQEELLYAATLTPSEKERLAIYQAASDHFDTWETRTNLAAALIQQSFMKSTEAERNQSLDEATTHLEVAEKASPTSAEVTANLALIYLIQGNIERAYEMIQRAASQNPSAENLERIHAIKGALEAHQGKYSEAKASFASARESQEVTFNKGLVALLTKDYTQTEQNFTALQKIYDTTQDHNGPHLLRGYLHYCLAILYARTDRSEDILAHLQKAIASHATLKQRALTDLEFRKYKEILTQL